MLHISSSSLRCIMKSNPKSDLGDFEELIKECANPMEPTYWLSMFIGALVLYALTDDEGSVMNEILEGLVVVAILNWFVLIVFTFIEYILKPHICRPSTRANLSSSVSSTDAFHFNPDTHINIHSI
ncbi:hypothetical protein TrLO_g11328 [Triparma laevis f. longispina]|uniref:Uncharacterized protein n=1 Tax=Triparma laevis f. longispina TaxID=1714387 RepID=A0A9W7C595_9STRA|nr:hypothetical protein TrLO_g11328 [Triparma laevis f. longispina]